MRFRLRINTSNIMKTTNHYAKIALLLLAVAMFTAMSARADTYSWTNFQSDIHGVAQHTDSNLVNPWGMAAGATGTIWVSDNGTGVSTLYNQDGTVVPLVVQIPHSANTTNGANPTGTVFNDTTPSKSERIEPPLQRCSSLRMKTAPFRGGTRPWIRRTPTKPSITA